MAGLIREKHEGVDVVTTGTRRPGEFSVWVDGKRVVSKLLPLMRPSDEKVLGAVERALA